MVPHRQNGRETLMKNQLGDSTPALAWEGRRFDSGNNCPYPASRKARPEGLSGGRISFNHAAAKSGRKSSPSAFCRRGPDRGSRASGCGINGLVISAWKHSAPLVSRVSCAGAGKTQLTDQSNAAATPPILRRLRCRAVRFRLSVMPHSTPIIATGCGKLFALPGAAQLSTTPP